MSNRPFRKPEQIEFQGIMIGAGLVASERYGGDDGARKFASAFKQLGFITDWSKGKSWELTPVGTLLLQYPQLEETIFVRQLLKYQLPSPLEESRTAGFHVRPFRLLLRLLNRAKDEGLIGLTKFEIGLFVITVLTEDDATFEQAFANIKAYRADYDSVSGKVAKTRFAFEQFEGTAQRLGLVAGTLRDYADSNSRYAFMSGLFSLHGNKLTLSDARLPFIDALLSDGLPFLSNAEYLSTFYDPSLPVLPTDDETFLLTETTQLVEQLKRLASQVDEAYTLPTPPSQKDIPYLQAYETSLRDELRRLREIQFYREQRSQLDEIEELLENINGNRLVGGRLYAAAYFEWAIWRLLLAINDIQGPVANTRGFEIDDDMRPRHTARGGAADLTFTYEDFQLVCEMTLTSGSRQFAAEGEPVTRHVYTTITKSDRPVYGLFIANKLDPNTADAFYKARYWHDWKTTPTPTPVVALETKQIVSLIHRMRSQPLTVANIKELLSSILELQDNCEDGPSWYKSYSGLYETWSASPGEV